MTLRTTIHLTLAALKRHPFALAGSLALACLPPALACDVLNLSFERGVFVQLAWMPLELLFTATALRALARQAGLRTPREGAWRSGLRWLLADLLVSARLAPLALASLIPGLVLAALTEPSDLLGFLPAVALMMLCACLPLLWLYRRCLAPAIVVLERVPAAAALERSPRLLAGHHKQAAWLITALATPAFVLGVIPDLMPPSTAEMAATVICLPLAGLLNLMWLVGVYAGVREEN